MGDDENVIYVCEECETVSDGKARCIYIRKKVKGFPTPKPTTCIYGCKGYWRKSNSNILKKLNRGRPGGDE